VRVRDVTYRHIEYQDLLRRLCKLWLEPGGIDRPEINRINARLREMLREDGIKEGFGQGGRRPQKEGMRCGQTKRSSS
jgi:hypothetical protein